MTDDIDLESCPINKDISHAPLEIDNSSNSETTSLNPEAAVALHGILNLISGEISAPATLSETSSSHFSMPVREYVSSKSLICLYFSAAWCPPCRIFSPKLSKWAKLWEQDVGVVFVSHDTSQVSAYTWIYTA